MVFTSFIRKRASSCCPSLWLRCLKATLSFIAFLYSRGGRAKRIWQLPRRLDALRLAAEYLTYLYISIAQKESQLLFPFPAGHCGWEPGSCHHAAFSPTAPFSSASSHSSKYSRITPKGAGPISSRKLWNSFA